MFPELNLTPHQFILKKEMLFYLMLIFLLPPKLRWMTPNLKMSNTMPRPPLPQTFVLLQGQFCPPLPRQLFTNNPPPPPLAMQMPKRFASTNNSPQNNVAANDEHLFVEKPFRKPRTPPLPLIPMSHFNFCRPPSLQPLGQELNPKLWSSPSQLAIITSGAIDLMSLL